MAHWTWSYLDYHPHHLTFLSDCPMNLMNTCDYVDLDHVRSSRTVHICTYLTYPVCLIDCISCVLLHMLSQRLAARGSGRGAQPALLPPVVHVGRRRPCSSAFV
jgi:hypothetical protein